MKKVQNGFYKLNPNAASIVLMMSALLMVNQSYAGAGWGKGIDIYGSPVLVPTYYANSPASKVPQLDATGQPVMIPDTNQPQLVNTGRAIRKFVDKLPGIGATKANNLGQYIPEAVPEKNWFNPATGFATGDDYYEIAAVEFSEKLHSDLPKATRLRGYVQLSTLGNPGKHIALNYPDGTPIKDVNGVQVYAYDNPHHLGPIITATSGVPVRIKFTNYLPIGAAGNLFLPVDRTVTGAGTGPDGVTYYTQNRTMIHLVGANAPWISAGSPHQWVAPVGEATPYARGASTQNVPDMADPGNGSVTLYFTNDISARFTFFHDRTSGITRLNTYAGLEAAYRVTDSVEQDLIARRVIPAEQIPLIIEDKTFVPANVSQQDAKWDTAHWGATGDLWFPHVYETNQDPNSFDGANPVGRWDWGPWFWPIFATYANSLGLQATNRPLPSGNYGDETFVPEAFFDTPLVNGTAYPTLSVEPKAYRFRILNASIDRYVNLAFYKADMTASAADTDENGNPVLDPQGNQIYYTGTEVKMVPAATDVNGNPPVPAYTDTVCQCQYPNLPQLNPALGGFRSWPIDGRVGGVPDPATVGPDFIAIGNDDGFLPHAVDIPSQPVYYETNRRSITVLNIYGHGLLLGPSERSDVIVDFAKYGGQTLILYNDAPTPVPFDDQRVDYYTGNPDFTDTGGTYSTKPGYGPNTRTILQIKVNRATRTPAPFNVDALLTEIPAAYGKTQSHPVIPESVYNTAFGTNDIDNYAHVATGSGAQPTFDVTSTGALTITGVTLVKSGANASGSGTGYDGLAPKVVIVGGGGTGATATATVDPATAQVSKITLDSPGSGYTSAPYVVFCNGLELLGDPCYGAPIVNGIGAQAIISTSHTVNHPVHVKAEQELFDDRGRYNSTGGIELGFTNAVTQTTVPLNYIDSPTDFISDGEIQIWKIVDNGLFSNSMHFDFVDVQLLNRVGWDGTVKAPANIEVGWKDTVRLNPLEDMILAMRAKRPATPFGLPANSRLKDPTKPITSGLPVAEGSGMGFSCLPGFGVNVSDTAFPIGLILDGANQAWPAPVVLPVNCADAFLWLPGWKRVITATNDLLSYDNEYIWYSAILSHTENDLMRPLVFHPTVVAPSAPSLSTPNFDGHLVWTDPTPATPGSTAARTPAAALNAAASSNNPQNEIGFKVQRSVNGAGFVPYDYGVRANVTSWTDAAPTGANYYLYKVMAYNAAGDSAASNVVYVGAPVPPTNLAATSSPAVTFGQFSVSLTWTAGIPTAASAANAANAANAASYNVYRDGVKVNTVPVTTTSYIDTPLNQQTTYSYQVEAVNPVGKATSAALAVTTPVSVALATPSNLTATPNLQNGTLVVLSWKDNANNETGYVVQSSTDGGVTWTALTTLNSSAAQQTATGRLVSYVASTIVGKVNMYSVTAINAAGQSLPATATVDLTAPLSMSFTGTAAPIQSTGLTAAAAGPKSILVSWTNTADNLLSFTVQRRAGAGTWMTIAPTIAQSGTSYSFTDSGLTSGTGYSYRVQTTTLIGVTAYTAATPRTNAP